MPTRRIVPALVLATGLLTLAAAGCSPSASRSVSPSGTAPPGQTGGAATSGEASEQVNPGEPAGSEPSEEATPAPAVIATLPGQPGLATTIPPAAKGSPTIRGRVGVVRQVPGMGVTLLFISGSKSADTSLSQAVAALTSQTRILKAASSGKTTTAQVSDIKVGSRVEAWLTPGTVATTPESSLALKVVILP